MRSATTKIQTTLHNQEGCASGDAPSSNGCPAATSWLSLAMGRLSFRFPLAYEFARLFRTFLHHSRILWWQGSIALADMGPDVGLDGNRSLVDCTRTHGRIADTRAIWSSNQWMSGEDLQLFLAGWNAGARWSDRHKHSCTTQKVNVLLHACLPAATSCAISDASLSER